MTLGTESVGGRLRRGRTRRGARSLTGVFAVATSGLLLAGCASMPDSGDVLSVDASQRADADSQVRVYGVPPRKNEQPQELVAGFLEATTSDEADYATARMYLAKSVKRQWDPSSSLTVLSSVPQVRVERSGGDREQTVTITLTGKQVAKVDARHAYKPDESDYQAQMHMTREDGEWRIDAPPDGLVLGISDFQRIYRSANKYYFAETGPGGSSPGRGRDVLVADPVYLRKRIDPVTSSVKALLDGPTTWLDPVAGTAFPTGTRLLDDRLSLDDSNALKVRLSDQAAGTGQDQCLRMAAQVFYTAQESAKVTDVTLERKDGSRLCVLGRDQAKWYAPDQTAGQADRQFFVDAQHRLVSLADGDEEPRRVPGPFGADGAVPLRSVAVDRSERRAAGVAASGQALYVAALQSGVPLGDVRVTARGSGPKAGLTAPSWDGLGDLWVADQDQEHPRLLRLQGGTGTPEEVQVPALDGGRITGVRVAADGVRIALLVTKGDHTSLKLGRVERGTSTGKPALSVQELRSVAPRLENVDAVSWAGASRLLVAGSEQGGLQQLQYIETDGSLSNTAALPGITGVRAIAAPESTGKSQALVAEGDGGIVRLLPDANWKLVAKEGTAPVYPG
ncbi:LpqB family beta-propeller domain-containing protein [Streptomyces morookaense]|uniref:GerMN domain-containing protein n=1 Tax=Streptomyces morookaense TaxID=1970 RepID=A0A7Y7BA73_STRMO|nr:LpqB family beta-propeller domain-containing protein [Streptomyces morookaense]NVK81893.1 GerMN domain-containing protein [Streptomyces morookaense]GHF54359.1 lipoprotein LpqB [Streptomyces morookaense]